MEVRKAHPGISERIDIRGREFGAERTDVGKAPVVREQDDDVRMIRRGFGGLRLHRKSADQGGDSDDGSTPGPAYATPPSGPPASCPTSHPPGLWHLPIKKIP